VTNQSTVNLLNKIIQNQGIHKKINTLIYCSNKNINFKKVGKVIAQNIDERIIKADVLNNDYFQKRLSLLQNIRFNTTFANIEIEPFLRKYLLKEQFEVLKHNNFKEISPNIWFQYEVLLYLYTNKNLLIEKNNFFGVLNSITADLKSLLENKEIFFLTSNAKQPKEIKRFFDVFIQISDNKYQVYKNFESFYDAITE
jgi:hypothetical protein